MDRHLRQLIHWAQRDPSDTLVRKRLLRDLDRLAGLLERPRWARAAPGMQDLVLWVVGQLLGPAFEVVGVAHYSAGGARHRIGAFRHRPSGALLHLLPGGRYLMGAEAGGPETPLRDVCLPPFLLGRTPVCQQEWDRVGGRDERSWRGKDLPIEGVSWQEATGWLSRAGGGLRLPSEAEWEYACRAGTRSTFFWGEPMDSRYCWFGENAEIWSTHPADEHAEWTNAFGLIDMAGNVSEWCQDVYAPYHPGMPSDGSPHLKRGKLRVVRGGDSFNPASHCRCAHRNGAHMRDRGGGIGFRIARSLPF